MKIGGYYTNVSFYILLSFASCLSQVLKARNMLRFPLFTVVLKWFRRVRNPCFRRVSLEFIAVVIVFRTSYVDNDRGQFIAKL